MRNNTYINRFNEKKLVKFLQQAESLCGHMEDNTPCIHVDSAGHDAVQFVKDGDGSLFGRLCCSNCMQTWNGRHNKNIEQDCSDVIDAIQNIIWIDHNNIDEDTLKKLGVAIDIIKEIPQLYDNMNSTLEEIKKQSINN